MKNKIVKYGSHFIILYQFIAIVVSVINLIYDFVTGKTAITFISYVSWFVPQYYISVTGNLWNLIPLILLIGITIFLFVKSSKCLLSDDSMGYKYPLGNIIWIVLNLFSYMMFFSLHWTGEPPYFSISNLLFTTILYIVSMILIFLKYPLLKCFKASLTVTNYRHIKKYAFVNASMAIFVIVLNFWMHYFGDTVISNPKGNSMIEFDMLMLFVFVIVNISLFVVTTIYYFDVKKSNSDVIPCKHFLLKINTLQISAIILEVGVILLNAFVFFYKG